MTKKLYEWTGTRWIISLSKKKGLISKKQEIKENEEKVFDNIKKGKMYKKVLEILPDAELEQFNNLSEPKDE